MIPGDVVAYDGRADGGRSEARVIRIVRADNPLEDAAEPSWAIEAVTTAQSKVPDTRDGSSVVEGGP